jgi:hypothetical protein
MLEVDGFEFAAAAHFGDADPGIQQHAQNVAVDLLGARPQFRIAAHERAAVIVYVKLGIRERIL